MSSESEPRSSSFSASASASLSQSDVSISGSRTPTTYRLSSTSFPSVTPLPSGPLAGVTSVIKEVEGTGTDNGPDETQKPTTAMSSSSSIASTPNSSSPSSSSPTSKATQKPEPTDEDPGSPPSSQSTPPKSSTIVKTSDDEPSASQRPSNSSRNSSPVAKTTHEVTTVPPTRSIATGTSTIVQSPTIDTTLSSPIVSTTFSNGVSFIVTPEWVTSLSTSTAPDGSYLTFTHVAANPTGIVGNLGGGHPFFSNTGATAGVFTAVGIVVGIIALGVFLLCRRRRRNSKREKWFKSMTSAQSEDPFADPTVSSNVPAMRISVDRSSNWSVPTSGASPRNTLLVRDHTAPLDPYSVAHGNVQAVTSSTLPPMAENIPTRLTAPVVDAAPPVSGRSTPSLYPPSISDYELSQSSDDRHREAAIPEEPQTVVSPVPPRPARSLLRNALLRPSDILYVTPPSAHFPDSNTLYSPVLDDRKANMSPISDGQDSEKEGSSVEEISRRPTLLGVRPRPAREAAPSGLQSFV